MSKHSHKNVLKIQLTTYLEECLSVVGRMMLEDLYKHIDDSNDQEAEELVEAYYDNNMFELIEPYIQLAAIEYEEHVQSNEGKEALIRLKQVMEQFKQEAIEYEEKAKPTKTGNNEGNGNVH